MSDKFTSSTDAVTDVNHAAFVSLWSMHTNAFCIPTDQAGHALRHWLAVSAASEILGMLDLKPSADMMIKEAERKLWERCNFPFPARG